MRFDTYRKMETMWGVVYYESTTVPGRSFKVGDSVKVRIEERFGEHKKDFKIYGFTEGVVARPHVDNVYMHVWAVLGQKNGMVMPLDDIVHSYTRIGPTLQQELMGQLVNRKYLLICNI